MKPVQWERQGSSHHGWTWCPPRISQAIQPAPRDGCFYPLPLLWSSGSFLTVTWFQQRALGFPLTLCSFCPSTVTLPASCLISKWPRSCFQNWTRGIKSLTDPNCVSCSMHKKRRLGGNYIILPLSKDILTFLLEMERNLKNKNRSHFWEFPRLKYRRYYKILNHLGSKIQFIQPKSCPKKQDGIFPFLFQ